MRRGLPVFVASLLFAGCATVPFKMDPQAAFQDTEPRIVVDEFEKSVGQSFELLESVVFSFFGKEFTSLGYLSINPDDQSYALSCMTPAGIKLFELKGSGDQVEALFVPPPMEKNRKQFAAAVGQDLRRIYFDCVPSSGAEVKEKKYRMVFKQKTADETVEYTFSGTRRLLTEKRFSKGWKTLSIVRYFDYKEFDGKLYPEGIILYNKTFHYRMVLRVKEVYPARAQE